LENLVIEGTITLRLILQIQDGTRCIWLRIGAETSEGGGGYCEYGTGILGYIKSAEFGDQLSNFQILKDFLLWSVRQTDREIDRQKYIKTDSQTDRLRESDRQTGRQTDRQSVSQIERQTARQTDKKT
jgi:hypothetical protein